MCWECGTIYALYELSKESQITDVVQTTDSPFESGKDFLGIGSRKLTNKRGKEQELDYIEDEDVKRELKKGSTLLSYSEQMP